MAGVEKVFISHCEIFLHFYSVQSSQWLLKPSDLGRMWSSVFASRARLALVQNISTEREAFRNLQDFVVDLKAFQQSVGLFVDGILGTKVW